MTKAELQAEIERLREELKKSKFSLQKQIDMREELGAQMSTLIAQDNAFIHLLEEILNIKVRQIETPRGVRWEDRKIVWGFYQLPDGELLHEDESLVSGYHKIWEIEQEVRRMRREDRGA